MPAVHQRVSLTETTPLSVDSIVRNVGNCITSIRHRYGYVDVTWTYSRDSQDFLTAASATLQDS